MQVIMTEPRVEYRAEQHYLGIRTKATMRDLGTVIPQTHDAVYRWLAEQGIDPAGAPFVRYHVIDMESELDVEMGVPVATPVPGDGRIRPGVLPAGRYAALVYTGVQNGVAANGALLEWGAERGLAWDTYEAEGGDGFGARYESEITDPAEEPDMAKWETEVAIRLADAPARSGR